MEMLYGNDFQKVYQEGKIVGEVFLEFLYIFECRGVQLLSKDAFIGNPRRNTL